MGDSRLDATTRSGTRRETDQTERDTVPDIQRMAETEQGLASAGPNTRAQYEDYYGMDIERPGDVAKLQRLEDANSTATVKQWADEGIPIDAMGSPSDITAYRKSDTERTETGGGNARIQRLADTDVAIQRVPEDSPIWKEQERRIEQGPAVTQKLNGCWLAGLQALLVLDLKSAVGVRNVNKNYYLSNDSTFEAAINNTKDVDAETKAESLKRLTDVISANSDPHSIHGKLTDTQNRLIWELGQAYTRSAQERKRAVETGNHQEASKASAGMQVAENFVAMGAETGPKRITELGRKETEYRLHYHPADRRDGKIPKRQINEMHRTLMAAIDKYDLPLSIRREAVLRHHNHSADGYEHREVIYAYDEEQRIVGYRNPQKRTSHWSRRPLDQFVAGVDTDPEKWETTIRIHSPDRSVYPYITEDARGNVTPYQSGRARRTERLQQQHTQNRPHQTADRPLPAAGPSTRRNFGTTSERTLQGIENIAVTQLKQRGHVLSSMSRNRDLLIKEMNVHAKFKGISSEQVREYVTKKYGQPGGS